MGGGEHASCSRSGPFGTGCRGHRLPRGARAGPGVPHARGGGAGQLTSRESNVLRHSTPCEAVNSWLYSRRCDAGTQAARVLAHDHRARGGEPSEVRSERTPQPPHTHTCSAAISPRPPSLRCVLRTKLAPHHILMLPLSRASDAHAGTATCCGCGRTRCSAPASISPPTASPSEGLQVAALVRCPWLEPQQGDASTDQAAHTAAAL